jgi:hypothetical protein
MKKLINAVLFVTIMILAFHHLQQFLSQLDMNLLDETTSYIYLIRGSEFVLYFFLALCMFTERNSIARTLSLITLPLIIFEVIGYLFLIGGAFNALFIHRSFQYIYLIKNVIIFIYFIIMVRREVSLRHLAGSLYIISPVIVTVLADFTTISPSIYSGFKLVSALLFVVFVISQRRYDLLHTRKINF